MLTLIPMLAMSQVLGSDLPVDGAKFSANYAKRVEVSYLLYLPEGYDVNKHVKYPFIMFLHGAGESGDDLNMVRRHGPPKEIAKGRKFPFIIVSPQCPRTQRGWDPDSLICLLNTLERKYRIDKEREYLTGLSMGGFGTWATASAFPDRFAAIAPIAAGGDFFKVAALRNVPTWVTHGDSDPVVPILGDQLMVDALKREGGDVRFDIIKGGDHDVWTPVYNGDELYNWFLTKTRPKPKK